MYEKKVQLGDFLDTFEFERNRRAPFLMSDFILKMENQTNDVLTERNISTLNTVKDYILRIARRR